MNMTKLKYVLLFLSLLASASIWAEGKLYTIRTNSFDCDYCVYDLEQKFIKMKGIKEFDTDVDGLLFIKTDNTIKLDKAFFKKMLIENGFDYIGMTEKKE
jgi:copper chaperone CopZ